MSIQNVGPGDCKNCKGKGWLPHVDPHGLAWPGSYDECNICGGTGKAALPPPKRPGDNPPG